MPTPDLRPYRHYLPSLQQRINGQQAIFFDKYRQRGMCYAHCQPAAVNQTDECLARRAEFVAN